MLLIEKSSSIKKKIKRKAVYLLKKFDVSFKIFTLIGVCYTLLAYFLFLRVHYTHT